MVAWDSAIYKRIKTANTRAVNISETVRTNNDEQIQQHKHWKEQKLAYWHLASRPFQRKLILRDLCDLGGIVSDM